MVKITVLNQTMNINLKKIMQNMDFKNQYLHLFLR